MLIDRLLFVHHLIIMHPPDNIDIKLPSIQEWVESFAKETPISWTAIRVSRKRKLSYE